MIEPSRAKKMKVNDAYTSEVSVEPKNPNPAPRVSRSMSTP
jgi:hypothetical protein